MKDSVRWSGIGRYCGHKSWKNNPEWKTMLDNLPVAQIKISTVIKQLSREIVHTWEKYYKILNTRHFYLKKKQFLLSYLCQKCAMFSLSNIQTVIWAQATCGSNLRIPQSQHCYGALNCNARFYFWYISLLEFAHCASGVFQHKKTTTWH